MFHTPCCISFSGMSGSGKTTLLYKILKNRKELFTTPPEKIMYFYGVWQKMFDSMERELPVDFVEGLPAKDIIDEFADGTSRCIVLDDLMSDVVKSIDMQHIFTRGSHHKNITVIYLNQNMYCQGKFSRTLSLNTQYIFILKCPRDTTQLALMGRQIGVGKSLIEAYEDVMANYPYGYLMLDLSPHNNDGYKLKTNIFPEEDEVVYIPV
jgi:hypothetical protein